jgi:hypothetical protein
LILPGESFLVAGRPAFILNNYWEGFFRCRELVEFVIKRARAGASTLETRKLRLSRQL